VRERDRILGLPFDALTMDQTLVQVERALAGTHAPLQHTVLNAAKVVRARSDPFLRASIEASDLVSLDGQAVVWAARLLGHSAPERVAGIDMMWELLRRSDAKGYRVYFLGARQEVLERLLDRVRHEFPGVIVAGARDGYFQVSDEPSVAAAVTDAKADILFVALPTPHKEQFIHRNLPSLGVRFAMGVGGSFDVLAGLTRRAPRWMQRAGLEWAYRLAQEPRRLFRRYAVTNAVFVSLVVRELVGGRRDLRSSSRAS
jgi:N-acetylglucosaminyldiphosphoundecaprenol N-acetyl-beta-D-mannosaminyltransferase